MKTYSLIACCAVLLAPSLRAESDAKKPESAAKVFVDRVGDDLLNCFADSIDEAYPFGRSNKAHDDEIAKAGGMQTTTNEWKLWNKHFFFDGDWFAVEWFYGATTIKTGGKQIESTLAFGKVKDGKIIIYNEFFDDTVGEMEQSGILPLYTEDEFPFPWPAGAKIKHPYRP
jgi:hypothetical protein